MKAKETETIKTLTEEWRKRDKEREILTKKKVGIICLRVDEFLNEYIRIINFPRRVRSTFWDCLEGQ